MMLEIWNMPNGTLLPVHYQSFDPKWTMLADEINTKRTKMKKQYFDMTDYDLKSLKIKSAFKILNQSNAMDECRNHGRDCKEPRL